RQRTVVVDGEPAGGPRFPIEAPRGEMRLERHLKGRDEELKLVERQAGEIEELRGARLHIGEPHTGHLWCLLSWEAEYTIIVINSHETDVDRQTRQGGDPRPGGGVPDAGEAPRASAQRLTPHASGASVDVDRHGRAATMEPGARECGHESGGSTDYRRLPGPAGNPARPAGAKLCEHAPAA